MINFPKNPNVGEVYSTNGRSWIWSGSAWNSEVTVTSQYVQSVASRTGNVVLTKDDVGLSNVDNTSDLNKPISTSVQTALNTQATHISANPPSNPVEGKRWIDSVNGVEHVYLAGVWVNLSGVQTVNWSEIEGKPVNYYSLVATTTNSQSVAMTGSSLVLENGESWSFEASVLANNTKTGASKSWKISGIIRKSFVGTVQLLGSLSIQTNGSIGGGDVAVTAQSSGLVITVTGVQGAVVDWAAVVKSIEKVSQQQAKVGGCTDPDVANYNANADFDNGSCSYPPYPSSAALELISSDSTITTLEVTSGSNSLYPDFDPAIKDYYVRTSAGYLGSASYSVTINGGTAITGTKKAGRTLQITDGTSYYYVRLLPNNVTVGTVTYGPTGSYVPGYYMSAYPVMEGSGGMYYYIHDHRGVPIWYGKTDNQSVSLHLGRYANRLVLNPTNGQQRRVVQLNSASVSSTPYNLLTSPTYGSFSWDIHDTQEIAAPASRAGNILGVSYNQGFYIQEQTPAGELVWEWHSKEYFNSQDPEAYHLNSVDVHPTTGNIIVSLRHTSSVLCIDYLTKRVLWVIQGNSYTHATLQSEAISSATVGTKWLTKVGEPTLSGYQYSGTNSQHDARWHTNIAPLTPGNEVISVYDNQTSWFPNAGPRSRGVIYEINYTTGQAIHRSSVFSDTGTSPYMGSYTLVEDGGVWSHALDFVTEHPALVEHVGPIDGTKTKVFAMDLPGHIYRIIKTPLSAFRLDNLRATCGVNLDTNALPADSGGGGGGGGSSIFAGTIAHWSLSNDGSGNLSLADASGNGNNLTMIGTVGLGNGVISGCATFNGDDSSYLSTTADIAPLDGSRTYSLWVKFNQPTTGYQFIFNHGASEGVQSILPVYTESNGKLSSIFNVNGRTSEPWDYLNQADLTFNSGQWYHVVHSLNGSASKLYVNGSLVSQISYSGSIYAPDTGTFTLGAWPRAGAFGGAVDGSICEVTVLNRAISSSEVTQLYNNGNGLQFTPVVPSVFQGIVSYWKLNNDGQGNIDPADASGNGNDLVNNGNLSLNNGILGNCIQGDGAGWMSTSSPIDFSGNFTINFWIKNISNDIYTQVFSGTIGQGLAVNWDSVSGIYFALAGISILAQDTSAGSPSGWQMVTVNRNNGDVRVLINGQQVASTYDTTDYTSNYGLLSYPDGSAAWANSGVSVDEVGIWNRAITTQEIVDLYNNGNGLQYTSPVIDLTQNLVNYWKFDNSLSPLVGNDSLVLAQGTSNFDAGKLGSAFSFDGYTALVSSSDIGSYAFGTNDFAISIWVYPTDAPNNNQVIFSWGAWPNQSGFLLRYCTDYIQAVLGGGDSPQNSDEIFGSIAYVPAGGISFNTWYHIVITRTNSVTSLYVNGQSCGQANWTVPLTDGLQYIGRAQDVDDYRLNGKIDEFAIWSSGLTPTKIAALYNNGNGLACTPPQSTTLANGLVAYWHLDDAGNGDIDLTDASGNGNDLANPNGAIPATGKISGGASFGNGNQNNLVTASAGRFPSESTYGSISAWFKADYVDNQLATVFGDVYRNPLFCCLQAVDSSTCNMSAGVTGVVGSDFTPITIGVWHHVVVGFDGVSTCKVWLDGSLLATLDATPFYDYQMDGFSLGSTGDNYGGNYQFNGTVDEVAVWNRMLTEDEVASLYNGGNGQIINTASSGAELAAEYLFDSGATLTDSSGNGNTLTNVNSVTFSNGNAIFNGSNRLQVTLPTWPAGSSFAAVARINWNGNMSMINTIVSRHDNDMGSIFILRIANSDGCLEAFAPFDQFQGFPNYVRSPDSLSPNTWYTVGLSYDAAGSSLSLWINGQKVGTTQTTIVSAEAYKDLTIGSALFQGGSEYFQGLIDKVAIYDVKVSDTLMASLTA